MAARTSRETGWMIVGASPATRHSTAQRRTGPVECFEQALAAAAAACEGPQASTRCINLSGGRRGILQFSDHALEKLLYPALAHQEVPEERMEPDFKILAWDSLHSGLPNWSPPWASGVIPQEVRSPVYNDERFRAVFQFNPGVLTLYDAERQIGLWWTQDFAQLPLYERAAPFLLLFHWWHALGQNQSCLLHAAAIGTDDHGALLLAGRGGSGKSTTALASLLDGGWRYVADDYCVVQAGVETPTVHSLYCSTKLDAKTLASFPVLSRGASFPDIGRDPEEKIVLNLYRSFPRSFRKELPLRAVVLPRVPKESNGDARNRFTPVGSGAAVRALAPSTLFQLPGAGASNFRVIAAVINRLPCFELELGGNFAAVPQSLRQFMERLGTQ
jgi:hypothetical protein